MGMRHYFQRCDYTCFCIADIVSCRHNRTYFLFGSRRWVYLQKEGHFFMILCYWKKCIAGRFPSVSKGNNNNNKNLQIS